MKIVWVSHDHGLSAGAELCLWEGVRGLVAHGHDVAVVVPSRGKLAERLEGAHIPILIIPYQWWMHARFRLPVQRLWRNLGASARLAAWLRQNRPDVVISNTLTIPVGAWAAHKAGIPHVWYIHEFGDEDHGLKFDLGRHASYAFIRRSSKRVAVNSRALYASLRRYVPEQKLRILFYAVDVPAVPESTIETRGPLRLILVGRICAGKRQEDAVRALSVLAKKGIDVHLSLVGNENAAYGLLLRRTARALGVDQRIEFLSFTEDPFSRVARSHVALVCSRSEAFGRVTVEAMKLGKPVIGADSGATSELIQDGITGLLYRPGAAEDLAAKIEILVRDRELLAKMGRNAREWSTRTFNLEVHTSDLIALLQEAVANPVDKASLKKK